MSSTRTRLRLAGAERLGEVLVLVAVMFGVILRLRVDTAAELARARPIVVLAVAVGLLGLGLGYGSREALRRLGPAPWVAGLPVGAYETPRGVRVRARFVGRVFAPAFAGVCLLLALVVGPVVDQAAPYVVFGGLAAIMGHVAVLARRHELLLDPEGVRRRLGSGRIVWADLDAVDLADWEPPMGTAQEVLRLRDRGNRVLQVRTMLLETPGDELAHLVRSTARRFEAADDL